MIDQISDPELERILAEEKVAAYAGFDPSSSSLQIGNLVGILALMRFQQAGHRPVALVGGATGMIGDPSGKDAERNLLTAEQVQDNASDGQIQYFFRPRLISKLLYSRFSKNWRYGYALYIFSNFIFFDCIP